MSMTHINHPINRADIEHYEGALVMKLVGILSGKTREQFSALNHRTRNRWLDKAVDAVYEIINDETIAIHLPILAKNLQNRM
jgi:hypothetical protein